ncbi:hypothetical protein CAUPRSCDRAFT_12003 [Caulochytrium protostelioides]|uniref:Uncharacterized protein n=2 Tax=Caulochytrium protostelioides TaxID=1555241 RepID=A0A4P9WT01_9FUNG|nr:hypothetical protein CAUPRSCDRAFT_12003 [Caulochytrium protostelioides]
MLGDIEIGDFQLSNKEATLAEYPAGWFSSQSGVVHPPNQDRSNLFGTHLDIPHDLGTPATVYASGSAAGGDPSLPWSPAGNSDVRSLSGADTNSMGEFSQQSFPPLPGDTGSSGLWQPEGNNPDQFTWPTSDYRHGPYDPAAQQPPFSLHPGVSDGIGSSELGQPGMQPSLPETTHPDTLSQLNSDLRPRPDPLTYSFGMTPPDQAHVPSRSDSSLPDQHPAVPLTADDPERGSGVGLRSKKAQRQFPNLPRSIPLRPPDVDLARFVDLSVVKPDWLRTFPSLHEIMSVLYGHMEQHYRTHQFGFPDMIVINYGLIRFCESTKSEHFRPIHEYALGVHEVFQHYYQYHQGRLRRSDAEWDAKVLWMYLDFILTPGRKLAKKIHTTHGRVLADLAKWELIYRTYLTRKLSIVCDADTLFQKIVDSAQASDDPKAAEILNFGPRNQLGEQKVTDSAITSMRRRLLVFGINGFDLVASFEFNRGNPAAIFKRSVKPEIVKNYLEDHQSVAFRNFLKACDKLSTVVSKAEFAHIYVPMREIKDPKSSINNFSLFDSPLPVPERASGQEFSRPIPKPDGLEPRVSNIASGRPSMTPFTEIMRVP